MIFQREMGDHFNQDFSTGTAHAIDVTSLLNRRLKLPPISSETSLLKSSRSSSQQSHNFSTVPVTVSLPQLDLCSLDLRNRELSKSSENNSRRSNKIENPNFSLPRVYSVLPPIGKKLTPSAPVARPKTEIQNDSKGAHETENGVSRRKGSTRKPRIKRQTTKEIETVSEKQVVGNDHVEPSGSSEQGSESFAIHITDTCLTVDGENCLRTVKEETFETKIPSDVKFPKPSKIPKELSPYFDVYPPSPLPNERRARNQVEKKRQELRDENDIRLTFMREVGKRRRNATCSELDEELKNAVKVLRDVFLRKTMEDLCMLW